jgi:hypothetical protein
LHIDFAKDAYRASNKRDYVEQMAVWLQRHEAMWLRESYLIWVEKRLPSMIRTSKSEDSSTMDEEEEVIDPINVNQCDINITHSHDNHDNIRYSLAKQPPHQNLTVEKLTQDFGTINFLPALSTFLRRHLPGTTITPSYRDRFDTYKQIVISLPSNRYLSERILMERVRTAPSIKASGQTLGKAAHFDTAFIVEDLNLYQSEGGISGKFFFKRIFL